MTDHYQIESVKFIASQWERIKEQVSQQQMRTSTVTTTAKHGPIYYCDKRTFSTVSEYGDNQGPTDTGIRSECIGNFGIFSTKHVTNRYNVYDDVIIMSHISNENPLSELIRCGY